MAGTKVYCSTTGAVRLDGAVEAHQEISVDEQIKSLVDVGKPVTAWEVASQIESGHTERVLRVLNGMSARGLLARFRAGFIDYYALPRVALTGAGPAPGTVIADSLKSLLEKLRYKVIGKN